MTNAIATDLFLSNLNTTAVTNDSLIADALVLSTSTFVILYRTENTLTEQTITLRLVSTVVDCFWFQNLSVTVLKDGFWRCQRDRDLAEGAVLLFIAFSKSHNAIFIVVRNLRATEITQLISPTLLSILNLSIRAATR